MRSLGQILGACSVALFVSGCSPGEPPSSAERTDSAAAPNPGRREASSRPRIVILGDSLTAGLGLDHAQAFPSLLQRRLDADGQRFEVVNAGVSGDTTAGGLRRLDWALEGDTRILIVALGANDGLRGLPPEQTRANLSEIISRAKARGVTVVLAGMEAPPNYGPAYTASFRSVFRELAKAHDVVFIPFLLEGVAGVASMNQRDGIHPNADGARVVEKLVWAAIEPIVEGTPAR